MAKIRKVPCRRCRKPMRQLRDPDTGTWLKSNEHARCYVRYLRKEHQKWQRIHGGEPGA